MGSSEAEGVLECSVDRLGVVASAEQLGEARVVGCDGSDVLGPVELASSVFVVGVESGTTPRSSHPNNAENWTSWTELDAHEP